MVVVAILTVRRAELAAFRTYETAAAAEMLEHGGRLERTVVVDDGVSDTLQEIHLVRFADAASFASYQASRKLAALRYLRDASVVETRLFVGDDGPAY